MNSDRFRLLGAGCGILGGLQDIRTFEPTSWARSTLLLLLLGVNCWVPDGA